MKPRLASYGARLAAGLAATAVLLAVTASTTSAKTTTHHAVGGTITVWDFNGDQTTREADAAFKAAYPNVTVKHVLQPIAGYTQLLQASLASHTAPDVVELLAGGWVQSFIPGLQPLDKSITPKLRKTVVSWRKVSKNYDTSQGTYAAPLFLNGFFWWYNKKLFKKAGLDPNRPPRTFPDLLAAAKKLKAAGITPFAFGDLEGFQDTPYFTVMASMTMTEKQVWDLAQGRLKFDSPIVRTVFKNYLKIAHGGFFEPSWATDSGFTDGPNLFAAGKAAMFLGQPPSYRTFLPSLGYRNVGVFQALGISRGKTANFLPFSPSLSYAVTKDSSNSEAAVAYALSKTSKPKSQYDLDTLGLLPVRKDVAPQPNAPPQIKQIVLTLKHAKAVVPQPHSLWPSTVQGEANRVIKQLVLGQISLSAMLQDLDRTMKTALAGG